MALIRERGCLSPKGGWLCPALSWPAGEQRLGGGNAEYSFRTVRFKILVRPPMKCKAGLWMHG